MQPRQECWSDVGGLRRKWVELLRPPSNQLIIYTWFSYCSWFIFMPISGSYVSQNLKRAKRQAVTATTNLTSLLGIMLSLAKPCSSSRTSFFVTANVVKGGRDVNSCSGSVNIYLSHCTKSLPCGGAPVFPSVKQLKFELD